MPQTEPKSAEARDAALNILSDLTQHPLGTSRGENFNVPQNYRIPPARIYVLNHSRTQKRKYPTVVVSELHGAEEALILDKELAKTYNVDTLTRQVEKGKDMTRYKVGIEAVNFRLRLPGGQTVVVPPASTQDGKPPAVEVPDGTWDLYMGNYNRMQGFAGVKPRDEEKFDRNVQSDEEARLALYWRQRYNPVFQVTDDGATKPFLWGGGPNPFGFLEFVRISQRAVLEPIDREYLTSLDVVEAI